MIRATWERGDPILRKVDPIRSLHMSVDVSNLVNQIESNPQLWNQHKLRTERYETPHKEISDIWVRYNHWDNLARDPVAFTQEKHESVWYPCVNVIPSVKDVVFNVFRQVMGDQLGGVLITRVPPGGEVKPHIDTGWHAKYYDKYAVQLKGNKDQGFFFEDAELSALPGEVYTFDNSKLHWVENNSDEDRWTLIICIRK